MLNHTLPPDVIAAHEAGHVVTALHLGLSPLGVRLVPTDTFAAATTFEESEFGAVTKAQRERLAFSGLAGQLYMGTSWKLAHFAGDRAWLLVDWDLDEDQSGGGGVELLANNADTFEVVNSRLRRGLSEGREFVPLEELLAD